jgi:single-stranded-DNA-specific exonuclease
MGNPVPKLLVKNCQLLNARNANIKDFKGNKIQYIKTDLQITDDSTTETFPVVWWGHYSDEVPTVPCDLAIELDYNNYKNRCEARIIELVPTVTSAVIAIDRYRPEILDFRQGVDPDRLFEPLVLVSECPSCWADLIIKYTEASQQQQPLALAYPAPTSPTAVAILEQLVGIAKFLARTGQVVTNNQLQKQLGISDRSIRYGWDGLVAMGFEMILTPDQQQYKVQYQGDLSNSLLAEIPAIQDFLALVAEELFTLQYFCQVPTQTLSSVLE